MHGTTSITRTDSPTAATLAFQAPAHRWFVVDAVLELRPHVRPRYCIREATKNAIIDIRPCTDRARRRTDGNRVIKLPQHL
jgi:hypothetical protein